MELVGVGTDTIRTAYEISAEKNHDVDNCFYISLARRADADALCTTDTDFERLCDDEDVEYRNPVPAEVLERFHAAGE